MFKNFSVSLFVIAFANVAQAAVVITVDEAGSDVVFTVSGNLDVRGLSSTVAQLPLVPGRAEIETDPEGFFLTAGFGLVEIFELTTADFPFLPPSSPETFSGTATGDIFGIADGRSIGIGALILLPNGYLPFDDLSLSLTFENQSLASMGIASGVFQSSLATGDTVTFEVSATVIPLPASLSLGLVGLCALAAVGRRRTG